MRKWLINVCIPVLILLIAAAIWVYQTGFLIESKIGTAIQQSQSLVRACKTYRLNNHLDGMYPAKLVHLVDPPKGTRPTLEGGKNAVLDPWGTEYKYAVVETPNGSVPYVWVEYEFEGRWRLVGTKLEAGEVRPFGPIDP